MKIPFLISEEAVEEAKAEIAASGESVAAVEEEEEEDEAAGPFERLGKRVVKIVGRRLMIVPGEMVAIWFKFIPEDLPYLEGAGYRIGAKVMGKEYHDYAFELYPLAKPKNVEKGFIGSLNVASFMYDYANFGRLGLVISAIVLAIIFVGIELVFDDAVLKFALNAFYVLMLSSSALTILLLSGGWVLVTVLFIFFKRVFVAPETIENE